MSHRIKIKIAISRHKDLRVLSKTKNNNNETKIKRSPGTGIWSQRYADPSYGNNMGNVNAYANNCIWFRSLICFAYADDAEAYPQPLPQGKGVSLKV